MPRSARIVLPGVAHHVTQRGNNRQIIFEENRDYLKYCFWINQYAASNDLEILSYCLMKNHVHFIVIPKNKESMSGAFQLAHMRYAQYMNQKRGASGHLWQGRFFSCPLSGPHLYRAIRYVELNPVYKQYVRHAWEYEWSSAKEHAGLVEKSDINLNGSTLMKVDEWQTYLTEEC